ncbi:MAG: FMN-dependent NADH-azoreductase [Gammaproteobacteria bacterium]|jgi:FMN-dependent NADH-azoreductase
MTQILRIDASANSTGASSKKLGDALIVKLQMANPGVNITLRDLNEQPSFIDESWVKANLTPADERSNEQKERLAFSDTLIDELQSADRILLTTPMYNFSVPATLKAWIDMVCRAGISFQYTSEGPVGLLKNKPVDIIITTGGVPLQSPVDFVSDYLKQIFRFIGIDKVNIIAADQMAVDADSSFKKATQQIEDLKTLTAAA